MELRHLRYFVTVAEELHFGRAATRLFIAQPPLSQQIQQLERELGVTLFARTSRRVQLTPAGEAFFVEARQILQSVEQAADKAKRAARGETGWLGIGFAASATYDLLPAVLHDFRALYPEVELSLQELNAAEQEQALGDKSIHIGFARPYAPHPAAVIGAVLREPFLVALPETHPFIEQTSLRLSALADQPFISFPELPKPSYAEAVRQACEQAGFTPRVVQEVREMQTALSLVAAGFGIALLPASVQHLHRDGVVYRPLQEPAPRTELAVVSRQDDPSPVLQNFLGIVRMQVSFRG
ncbi:MAG: LysR substrate-binding domain-containing protein [Janthinobacterium lividum]